MQIRFDGPYRRVRTWYSQFYNSRDKAAEIADRVAGTIVTFGESRGRELAEA
jgi:3-ketosteroid 9alpha-monooxygenase subunit A